MKNCCFLSFKKANFTTIFKQNWSNKYAYTYTMYVYSQENKHVLNMKSDHGCQKAGRLLSKNAFD